MSDRRHIAETIDRATPGPWSVEEMPETGECRVVAAGPDEPTPSGWYPGSVVRGGLGRADADLIVLARTALGPLVAEVEALEEQLAEFKRVALARITAAAEFTKGDASTGADAYFSIDRNALYRILDGDAVEDVITITVAEFEALSTPKALDSGPLEIVNGWLVERGVNPLEYPAGAAYGSLPYSDAEPLLNLSGLPGWPGANEEPTS